MLIDCDACEVRGLACDDCVVTALLDTRPGTADDTRDSERVDIDAGERRALRTLAGMGVVPPLRLTLPDSRAS